MTSDPGKKALEYFDSSYNCAQSTFKAILEHKGLYFDKATQVSSAFGGGITHTGQQCGAISGAIMAIGALVGRTESDVSEHKAATYRYASEFIDRFTEEFRKIRCDDLTGINMSDEEALKEAIDKGHFRETCPKFVEKAVKMVLEMFPD